MPSEDEVRARLDRLKGVSSHSDKGAQQQQAQFYQPPDTRTATEQVNHLVTATSAKVVIADACTSERIDPCLLVQVDLEARHVVLSPEEDIAGRLARLRGEPKPDFASKQDLIPDPNLYLSGDGDQKAQAEEEGVDEVGPLCPG